MNTLIKLRTIGPMALAAILFAMVYSCGNNASRDNQSENEEFVSEAASSNSLEIAAGSMAVSKAQHQAVQSFGQQMVDDHTAMREEMKTLAESKGWTVPTELLNKHEQDLGKIGDLTGTDFDREFVDLMIRSHEDAIDLFTDFVESDNSNNGNNNNDRNRDRGVDPELKDFASNRIPGLRSHLDQANRLKDSIDARQDTTRSAMDSIRTPLDSLQRRDPMN